MDTWGRFLVMIAGASIVIMTVLVVACFVGPGCWGFEYLRREEQRKKQKNIEKMQSKAGGSSRSSTGFHWLDYNNYAFYETAPGGFEGTVPRLNEACVYNTKERVFNLKCAPLLVAPNLYSTTKSSAPRLDIKLFYCSLGGEEGRFTVQIISSTTLPPREYVATLDPFVMLEILNNKWSLQKNERIVHSIRTRVVKNSLSPIFDETFVFEVKKVELKNWCLKFTISDDDRLTRINPLFERRIHLKELKGLTERDSIPQSLEMQEMTGNMGSLFFGITYLPTAQRLNISFIKAYKLKYQTAVQSVNEFYPYVRVVMVNNHGRCIKKKKTPFKHKEDNPIFNHSLVFDLSISNLEQTVFLVLLCTKVLCQPSNSDDSSLDGDIETNLAESSDKVLGTIVLGRNVRCTRARDHWVSVMQNPRKMISVWHDLR